MAAPSVSHTAPGQGTLRGWQRRRAGGGRHRRRPAAARLRSPHGPPPRALVAAASPTPLSPEPPAGGRPGALRSALPPRRGSFGARRRASARGAPGVHPRGAAGGARAGPVGRWLRAGSEDPDGRDDERPRASVGSAGDLKPLPPVGDAGKSVRHVPVVAWRVASSAGGAVGRVRRGGAAVGRRARPTGRLASMPSSEPHRTRTHPTTTTHAVPAGTPIRRFYLRP